MEWWLVIIIFLAGLGILLASGLPVAFSFLLVNLVGAVVIIGSEAGLRQLIISMQSSITVFTLVPIPMFILMGEILFHSGIAVNVLDVLDKWLGRLPGRLSLLAVGSGTLFSTLSGSTLANTAMLGTMLAPDMKRRGYGKALTLGPIMASGGLAMIIPPSALAVVLASLARMPIGKILIAGFIPGLFLAAFYSIYIIGRALFDPSQAPVYKVEPVPWSTKIVSFAKYVLPLGLILFLVLGFIFLGIATPSESAALGALGSIILAAVYGKLNWEVLKKAFLGTAQITIMIFIIMVGATLFSQLLAFSGASRGLVNFVLGKALAPIVVLIMMQFVLLFLGTFMEQVAIMMVTLPLFVPIMESVGIEPIWFGILMLINLEVGLTTPPFGLILFVMKGVAPKDVTMADIYRAALPFVVCDLLVMILIMIFPTLVTWLPGLVME